MNVDWATFKKKSRVARRQDASPDLPNLESNIGNDAHPYAEAEPVPGFAEHFLGWEKYALDNWRHRRDRFLEDNSLSSQQNYLHDALWVNDSAAISSIVDEFITIRNRSIAEPQLEKIEDLSLKIEKLPKSQSKAICPYTKITNELAEKLEEVYVQEAYEKSSDDGYESLEKVEDFINNLEPGSLLLDVGCGKGNYLNVNPNIVTLGFDHNMEFVRECHRQNHQVAHGQCLYLPYRKKSLDAVICINVLHHLSTEKRRRQAIAEIMRVLRPGGKALIYVWAKDNGIKRKSDKDKLQIKSHRNFEMSIFLPLYKKKINFKDIDLLMSKENPLFHHVFNQEELMNLCLSVPKTTVTSSYEDQGNCCVVCEKMY
ncbi:hypothetical protein TKK_0004262 [Trichogramma kaykai]